MGTGTVRLLSIAPAAVVAVAVNKFNCVFPVQK